MGQIIGNEPGFYPNATVTLVFGIFVKIKIQEHEKSCFNNIGFGIAFFCNHFV